MHDREKLGRRIRRSLNPVKRWIARTSTRLFVALGILVFIVLMLPGTFTVLFGSIWGCVRGRLACSSIDLWVDAAAILGMGVLYLIVFVALKELVGTVVWSRMRKVTGREARCRALIMGLSDLRSLDAEILDHIKRSFGGRPRAYALSAREFEQLGSEPNAPAPQRLAIQWQQNVRAMFHHGEGLEAVLVLPSKESLTQWPSFSEFMAALFPGLSVDLVRGTDGEPFKLPEMPGQPVRSYEDYDYLLDGLSLAVQQVQEAFAKKDALRPLDDHEICIDVTAGPKTFSIAGAIVTLNRDLKLSYVSTGGIVTIFNAEIGVAESLTRTLRIR